MKNKTRYRVRGRKERRSLRLPDLEHSKAAVLSSLTNTDAQHGYRHAVDWYCSERCLAFNRTVVLRYRGFLETRKLAPGTINLRLGAVRRLAYESRRLRPAQRRPCRRDSPRQGSEEPWRASGQLAHC
jgi:hypothetical protein